MGKIDVKEFLRSYRRQLAKIDIIEQDIETYRSEAENTTQAINGLPHGSAITDKVGNITAKIVDRTSDALLEREIATDKRKKISNVIRQVNDERYMRVLFERYIKGEKWEQIAVNMGYDYRYILKLHGRALQEVDKILNQYQ